jgi:hypothetical protein
VKTWEEALSQTWLTKDAHVLAVDQWVRSTLAAHRGLDEEGKLNVAPWTITALVKNIREFGIAREWLWCVATIAIMQELIFCAADGGINLSGVAMDRDLRSHVHALKTIRNVVFHPAFQVSKGGNPPPMEDAIKLLGSDDDIDVVQLAKRLPTEWASFAERPVAVYALRKLGAAGEIFVARMRLLPKR